MKMLSSYLSEAVSTLNQCVGTIESGALDTGAFSEGAKEAFKNFERYQRRLTHTQDFLSVRNQVLEALDDLDDRRPERASCFGVEVTADFARLLLLQNYVTCTWAIYDIIAGMVGSIYVPQSKIKNEESKLCWDLLSGNTVFLHSTWLKGNFGWPIVISYKLRNLIVHDAGLWKLQTIFTGSLVTFGFQISHETLAEIASDQRNKQEKGSYKFTEADTIRTGWPWTSSSEPCILELLKACHVESDAAMGIMVSLWTRTLRDNIEVIMEHRSTS